MHERYFWHAISSEQVSRVTSGNILKIGAMKNDTLLVHTVEIAYHSVSGVVSTGVTSKAEPIRQPTASSTATKSGHTNGTTSGRLRGSKAFVYSMPKKADAVIGDVYYCAYHALKKQKGA